MSKQGARTFSYSSDPNEKTAAPLEKCDGPKQPNERLDLSDQVANKLERISDFVKSSSCKIEEFIVSKLRELAKIFSDDPVKSTEAFAIASSGADLFLEELKPFECYDPEELHELRQQPGYDPRTCRVITRPANDNRGDKDDDRPAILADDTREQVRQDRVGESQAPPPLWVLSVRNDNAARVIGRAV